MADQEDRSPAGDPLEEGDQKLRPGAGDDGETTRAADGDARVELIVAEDRMSVRAQAIFAHSGEGRVFSEQILRESLAAEGICIGIQDEAVSALVLTFERTGRCDSRLILARGIPPGEGREGWVDPVVENEISAVFPENVFARLVPTRQPEPGQDVTGSSVPAPSGLPEARIVAGACCRLSDEGTEAISTAYGAPRVEGFRAFVETGVRIVDDGLTCLLDIYPVDSDGRAIEEAALIQFLESAGIKKAFIDLQAVHSAWAAAQSNQDVQPDVPAARGIPPQPGRDGEIDFTVDIQERVGTLDDRGRIDFKEQNRLHRVQKNDRFATIIPPTEGRPGTDVRGHELPARPGRPAELKFGPGAREEDGGIFANLSGVLIVRDSNIDVSNAFRVSGDVDYHSGNIGNDSGNVYVQGSVLAGFRVTAGGDVEIGRSVEGGTVEAGGELIVRDAIIGREDSTVRAVRNIRTSYVQNANLVCDGNLFVERELIQSQVKVTGVLKMIGQPGTIVGGEIEADGGIITTALGSSNGTPTMVRIGRGTRRINLLRKALNEKTEPLERIRAKLGVASQEDLLDRLCRMISAAETTYARTPSAALSDQITQLKERRASLRRLLRLQSELAAECEELKARIEEAQKERDRQVTNGTPACVEVRGNVYPGVVFMIDGATYPVTNTVSAVRFFYNPLKRRVEARRNF